MKYVDASAVLRVLFVESGPSVPLLAGDHVVPSRLIEVEAFRAVDRERLLVAGPGGVGATRDQRGTD